MTEIIIFLFENTLFLSCIMGIIAAITRCSFPTKKQLTNINDINREGKNWIMIPNHWNDKQFILEAFIISIASAIFFGVFIFPNYMSILFGSWQYVSYLILTFFSALIFKSVEDLIFYIVNYKNKDIAAIKLDILTIIRSKEDIPKDLKNVLMFIVEHQDELKEDFTNIVNFIKKITLDNLNKEIENAANKVNKLVQS